MPIHVLVGAQWGDEGKGKLMDAIAGSAAYVVRFQGGANAGHSISNEHGRFVLHLLPSGAFHPHVTNVIGAGVALDAPCLLGELEALRQGGVSAPRLLVSDRARLLLTSHRLLDHAEEERLGSAAFGSTRRGIAPFYATKALKLGIPLGCCGDADVLRGHVEGYHDHLSTWLTARYALACPTRDDLISEARAAHAMLSEFLADTGAVLRQALRQGQLILGEGQLGALRDIDHGIIPWTTSTSTLASAIGPGAGIPLGGLTRVIAAVKCYSSCVGAGPMVSELDGTQAEYLRRFGQERASTTGRIRRVGWLDLVATGYGLQLQGATEMALTMLDVLSGLQEIRLCREYRHQGVTLGQDVFPACAVLSRCEPVYHTMPGWDQPLGGLRSWGELPDRARGFIRGVEAALGLPVTLVSVGPHREQLIAVPASSADGSSARVAVQRIQA
jgi:adenylosuccinate synthase